MRDFVEYWAASRLLVHGGNPYSPLELLPLQQSAGWSGAAPLIMWNPPWTLLITLPFSLFDIATGQFIWLVVHVILILFSARQLWRIYGKPGQSYRWSWVLAFSFVPTVFVLVIGQITPIVLAGVSLLLYAETKQKQWIMSIALVILSIKPHLLYLFWIVFALWVFQKRRWRMISGAAAIGVAVGLAPLLFDSKIYSQYLALYQSADVLRPLDWPVPTLRNVIKLLLHVGQTWMQFSPTIIGVVWAVYYWQRHKHEWMWRERLPLVILVSVTSSFFVWTYDYVVILPALIEGATWLRQSRVPWHSYWSVRVYIAINTLHLLARFWLAEELWYFWLAPALLLNYLILSWEKQGRAETIISDPK
jgi:hypothetical protein